MKESKFFVELSKDSILPLKDKKELVLDHKVRVIKYYITKVRVLKELEETQKQALEHCTNFSECLDLYLATSKERHAAEYQLSRLKQMSKRRAIKEALDYHWDFVQ